MAHFPGLVIDTSIWINLLATQRTWAIIRCLSTTCAAPEQVVGEVQRDPISGRHYPLDSHPLRGRSELEIVDLQGASADLFCGLVGNAIVKNLGDGEAASIAIAADRGWAVAIDERKARRLVRERFPGVPFISTFELLSLPEVERCLGRNARDIAIADAKRFGRMHVPRDVLPSVRGQ